MRTIFKIEVSDHRVAEICSDIARGSRPEARFYLMVAASSILAALGLVSDSTAVVIGAMLVAPLMTPIFGISLSLVRGDTQLMGHAIKAEIAGVLLAILLAVGIGFIMPEFYATGEMLSRTKPNLLDLMVAVFAGFAGAYAMVDEHISPVLPGVAIATAIVPPLANTGLCIALGAHHGALGSFLLFFANFLSVLLVTSAVFIACGMARVLGKVTPRDLIRKFGLAGLSFLLVAGFLSKGLYDMVQARRTAGIIDEVVSDELAHLPASELKEVSYQVFQGSHYVLAHVVASGDIAPSHVRKMEIALEQVLNLPVELFVRLSYAEDISDTGSMSQFFEEGLDGFYISKSPDTRIGLLKQAEQVIREYTDTKPFLQVKGINFTEAFGEDALILITLQGLWELSADEIKDLEAQIRLRTGEEQLALVVRHLQINLKDRYGRAYFELGSFENYTPEQDAMLVQVDQLLDAEFAQSTHRLVNTQLSLRGETLIVLVELASPVLFSKEELGGLKSKLAKITGNNLKVYVRSTLETVVSDEGNTTLDQLKNEYLEKAQEEYAEKFRQLTEQGL